MRNLGVSIYPEKSDVEKDKQYLTLAKENGFARVFTCLLSADKPKNELVQSFKEIIFYAKELGMEVILDVAPTVFDRLGISYDDLSFFADIGADGIRLDAAFDGKREAALTYNAYNLKIELNMSNDIDYLNNILSHQPNKENLIGCHNFYPQKYTGLPYDFFVKCSERFKDQGIRTAAFVTCQGGTMGPWDINDGLCTLEEHRNIPIHVQAKHLWATGLIDDVIIGNGYATEAEIVQLGALNRYILELDITLEGELSDIEKAVVLSEQHVRRGDITEFLVRSTEVRKKYIDSSIAPRSPQKQEVGCVVIGNDNFGKYKAELQIVLKELPIDTRKNNVARVNSDQVFLIDYITPWRTFIFKESSN
ncbi:hypothetical protein GCM10012290_07900 [Halolactibacillus alkaliphilus]|uniref:Outer surface protein n=1 Tax=Halolactibacillus alkaliphilus TaxID=442899 RepID=A0A511X0A6_9BACI|nr:MupG family TIM beta-alpha barrel fold protein [Halolactibacillus alkaliphilus]GEN56382.1 hypothetical protein HAL01_08460 [Halolactibacillus alkaliphilus]GGN67416.1 hypothetical protein GCM10012290_07900 [Halolactibacillus alkaliphilus]SFO92201.1 hypothetical protein SAMN05720591_12229 [Halolactibacillus alkaliphilus]